MSHLEELQNGESEVLVKTAKEACAEGLVVTGGGKDGIFIKEVKPDSPASKHLRVKEGDQILSATVYFDNVSYEDALQILEHAQAYKMEFCLRRKPPEVQEDTETARPEGEGSSPKLRGRKTKRQEARISWPKFPSFSKGRKGFKRSHSTSEAEEQRKLEMSPTTSDTESPVKSPLKSPDGKEKKKKRLKLKVKMKGLRSKSVEHPTRDEEPTLENLDGVVNQVEQNGTDIQSPEEMQLLGEPQVVEQEAAESHESTKVRNEYTFPSLTGPEMETGLHKVELITLDKTLKTTDISVAFAEESTKDKRSPESVQKMERSELRVNIQGKDLLDTVNESQIKSSPVSQKDLSTSIRTSDPSTYDNVVISSSVMSHTEFSDHQLNIDINAQATNQGRTEKILGHGEMDMSMPKVDVSLDMSDIGLLRKSPRIGGEKQWKDRTINIPEPESYGIRTRGPLADIATSKATFDAINGLQFTSSVGADASNALKPDSDLKYTIPTAVIAQPKSSTLDIMVTDQSKDGTIDIKIPKVSEIPMETSIEKVLADISTGEGKVKAEFKLPKVDMSDSNLSEPIKMTKMDNNRPQLPNREELEIPGMEDATLTAGLQIQGIKLPQIDERDGTKLTDEIQAKRTEIEFNLEDVKALVAKIPTFKLPRIDMSGIYTHKEITPDSDKILGTAGTSPPELSEAKTEVSLKLPDDTVEAVKTPIDDMMHQDTSSTIKLPNIELPHLGDHEQIIVTHIEDSKPKAKLVTSEVKSMTVEDKSVEIKYKLPKREDIEIPGMEAIEKTTLQMTPDVKPVLEVKVSQKPDTSPSYSIDRQIQIPLAPADAVGMKGTALIIDGKTKPPPTDRKDRDKKTKKTKKSMPSFGITKPDIRFPDIGIDFPKQTTSPEKVDDSQVRVDTKVASTGDKMKIKLPQTVPMDTQDLEMGIKGLSIKGETETLKVKEEGEIHIPVQVDIPATDIKIHGDGISLPHVKETVVLNTPNADISASPSAGIETQVNIPEVDVVTPSMDVKSTFGETDVPEIETKETDIKLKKRKISFPKFSLSRSEVKTPEVGIISPNVDIRLPETSVDIKDTEIDATAPESEAQLKDKHITGSPTKFKLPTLKFPKFGMSPQKIHTEPTDEETAVKTPDDILDIKLPEHELSISGKLPTIDLHTIQSAEGPKPPSTEPEGPALNLSIRQPEVETPSTDTLITQGKDNLEIEKVEGSSVEGKVELPQMEVKVQEGKSFKLPKFGISMPKIKGPDVDIHVQKSEADTSLPEGKINIEQPDVHVSSVKTDTDMPKVDVELPSVDVKIGSADTDTSVEIEAKESDTKDKKRGISFPKFSFSRSDSKGSDVEVEPPKADITDAETDMKKHEDEAALKDKTSSPTKFKLPTLKFPKFGMSPTKVQTEGIDVDVVNTIPEEEILEVTVQQHDLSLSVDTPTKELTFTPGANVDITTDVEARADVPQIKMETHELDTKSTEGGRFKLPKFGISLPKVKGPEISMTVSKPEAEVSMPEEKTEIQPTDGEIKMASVEAVVDTAHVESKETDIKFKMPKMSFPKFGHAKSEVRATEVEVAPKLDISLSDGEVKIKDGLEVTSPKAEQKVDVKDPDLEIKAPDVELKESAALSSSPSKFKLPTFKMPKFGYTTPKVKADTAVLTADMKSPEVKLTGVETETTMPVSSIDLSVSTKMPEILGKAGQISMQEIESGQPQVNIDAEISNLEKPDIKVLLPKTEKVEVEGSQISSNLNLPSVDLTISKPNTDITGTIITSDVSSLHIDPPEANISISGKVPCFDSQRPSVDIVHSSVDAALKGPEIDVQPSELLPSEVKVEGLAVEGDAEVPQLNIKGPDGSQFKMPKFGISLPKVKVPDMSMSVTKPEVDMSVPEGKAEVTPDSKITGPSIDTELPQVDTKELDAKMKKRKISFPKFGFSKPEVKAPEVDITLPNVDVSLQEGEIKEARVDVKIPEDSELIDGSGMGKFKLPTFKLPKIGVSASKGAVDAPDMDIDVKAPQVSLPETELKVSGKVPALDVKGSGVELEIPSIDVAVDTKGPEVEVGGTKSISLTKGPEAHVSVSKPDVDVSLPEGKVDVEVTLPEGKVDIPGVDSKGLDVKMKRPSFSFPKFGMSKAEVKAPEVNIPEGKVEVTHPDLDVKIPEEEAQLKDINITSPTKFKFPTIKFPKIGVSAPKGTAEVPDVDIKALDVKVPEVDMSVSKADLDISLSGGKTEIEAPLAEVKGDLPDANLKDIDIKAKKPGFSFPKFGFSKPEVKGGELDISLPKADISLKEQEGEVKKAEVDAKILEGSIEGKDSKGVDIKMKRPSFSFPKFGLSKTDVKGPDIDVDVPEMSLPEEKVEIKEAEVDVKIPEGDVEYKDANIHTSPTKFKLPTLKFPKIGVSASKGSVEAPGVDINVKAPEVSLSDAELKVSGDIPELDLKGQNVDVQLPSIDVKAGTEGPEVDGQGSKFKLPKFGISLPKVKAQEFDASVIKPDLDVSLPEGKAEVDASLPEGKAEIPEIDSKDIDVKIKRSSFSFPKFGVSKPDVKGSDIDVNLPEVHTSLSEGKVEVKGPEIDAQIPEGDVQYKDTGIHTSPTKFKLPTFKLPRIGISAPKGSVEAPSVDINVKAPEVSLPDAELKVSGEVPEVDLKGQNMDVKSPSKDMHAHAEGPDVQGSKLKFPKFGISLPKVKGPEVDLSVSKADVDVSLPEGKVDAEASLPEQKTEISGVDSRGIDIKMKRPSFSFPKFGLSKPDVKAPEVDVSLPEVDISQPEVKVEVKETEHDVKGTEGDVELKDTSAITSPTKFKLPTFKFPKIGVSAPKGEMDVDVKAPEDSGTDAELKVSVEVPAVDVQAQPVDVQTDGYDIDGQGSKIKLPKFGISLPKVKGPSIDISVSKSELDTSIPEQKIVGDTPSAEVHTEIPEVDSKGLDVKMKKPSFSFPKFGLSKSDVKAADVDVTLPETDVSLPECDPEVKDSGVGVQVDEGEVELKGANISGSPSKFKLPTIKFPRFGITTPKVTAEIENLDASIKGPDVNLPDSEGKVSGELSPVAITGPSVDIKTTTTDVDMKTKGVDMEGQGSKFKLPKFGIGLPKVKGPEADVTKTDTDVTLPEGEIKLNMASAEVERSSATVEVDLPELDSKGIDVNVKKPSFSFPKFGFSKPDIKTSEVDTTLTKGDITLSEGKVEVKEPKLDNEVEAEVKDVTISGSPSKFKLPTIKFPKFGVTVQKVEQDTDMQVKGQAVMDSELNVSGEPTSIDIRDVDVDVQTVGVGTEGQGSKFKLPKFGVSLSKVKSSEVPKPEVEVSLPESKVDIEGDVKALSVEAKVDLSDVDLTARKPGFSFPKFGFTKPEVKPSEFDGKTPQPDVSKPEGIIEAQDVTLDVKNPDESAVSSPTKFKLPAFKLPTFGGSAVKSTMEVTVDSSLPQATAEVKPVDAEIKGPTSEVTLDKSDVNIEIKEVRPRISFPKFGFSKPASKDTEVDVTPPSAEVTLPEGNVEPEIDVKAHETESKGESAAGGSPSKFKLPTIKLPRFGVTPKINIEAEVTVPEGDSSSVMIGAETEVPAVEGTAAPDNKVSTQSGDNKAVGSPSKFKLPTFKMPKLSLSRAKSEEDAEVPSDVKSQEASLETGDKDNTQVTDKSPKFTLPTVQDVLRGFDVEFHVPTLDETDEPKGGASPPGEEELKPAASVAEQDVEASTDQEKSKFALQFSKLGLTQASRDSGKVEKTDVTVKEVIKEEQKLELQTEHELQAAKDSDTGSEKGSWFKLPKFPSPTKSFKLTEKETAKPSEEHEQNTESENLETEISITSSVRSSDAFADESSTLTTEQIGPSLASPTKVTVKYAEPISPGTGDVTAKIITSTARTELISMEPDLPEKVNISFSSESSSMDTLKQESGAIRIITSNVQTIPDTQLATILTDFDSHAVQSMPIEQVIVKTTTPWSMQETSTMQEDSIVVERHVIKEISGEKMETVIITQKTCMLDADSGEPNSSAAASSSQKLRDTVHSEKMRFFEGREMPVESIVVSSVTTETSVIKHSTEEHHGK